ncbi:hypothetical protein ACH5RR_003428 [Cinchona calisaya]|uniref:Uncharacterized protein n=1 Tax=Cinchona calisaya TaxID=153742 RepID=A0ABD3AUQ6_9GENT
MSSAQVMNEDGVKTKDESSRRRWSLTMNLATITKIKDREVDVIGDSSFSLISVDSSRPLLLLRRCRPDVELWNDLNPSSSVMRNFDLNLDTWMTVGCSKLYHICKRVRYEILVRWTPPRPGFVELNSDATAGGNPGLAGVGGLIRDHLATLGSWS